jgi:hypothetical protein
MVLRVSSRLLLDQVERRPMATAAAASPELISLCTPIALGWVRLDEPRKYKREEACGGELAKLNVLPPNLNFNERRGKLE